MSFTTGWLTMAGSGFHSVTSLLPRWRYVTQSGWTPLAHAATASTWSSWAPLSASRSVNRWHSHLEGTPELSSCCACRSLGPHYARLANTARAQLFPTQLPHANPEWQAEHRLSTKLPSCLQLALHCCAPQLQNHQAPSRRGLYTPLTFLSTAGVSPPGNFYCFTPSSKVSSHGSLPHILRLAGAARIWCLVTLPSCLPYCTNHSEFQFNAVSLLPTLPRLDNGFLDSWGPGKAISMSP